MKYLKRSERNFNVCSDCAHFEKGEPIDERYPEIVYGYCNKFEKNVDNRWDANCKDCTYGHTCEECIYFNESTEYDEDTDEYINNSTCERHYNDEADCNDKACEDFERYYE